MTRARSEWLPGWRAGLLVLGLYAMFMQAFFTAASPPTHVLAGPDTLALCVSGDASTGGQKPVHPHSGKDCVCSALCHAGVGAVAAAPVAFVTVERFAVVIQLAALSPIATANNLRATPPARAPPREAFVFST